MRFRGSALFFATFIVSGQCHAQQDALVPSSMIVEKLTGTVTNTPGTFSRYRNLVPVTAPSIDLKINFRVGAATLGPGGKTQLLELSKALSNDLLRDKKVVVEGHTDAQGSPELNLRLSSQRATAVVVFLIDSGIDRDRLSSVGKGYSDLLDKQNPTSAKNRRVTVRVEAP